MRIFNRLLNKNKVVVLLKNRDFFAVKESGGAIRETGQIPAQNTSLKAQFGRTMTEMLGTLAIIGVLSIGGIAGYNYAMDKYRANTTVNEINMRMVDLVLQSSRGIELNLDEWSDTSMAGYTFDGLGEEGPLSEGAGLIYLQISSLPERVCEMVADTLGTQFDLAVNGQHYSENNSTLCGDDNKIRVYFERNGAGVTCEPACASGEICINGICVDDEQPVTPDGISCSTNTECPACWACSDGKCGDSTTLNNSACGMNGTGTCQNGVCKANSCRNGEACGSGFFCADSNSSCTSRMPNQCTGLNGYFVRKTITVNGNTETWYVSNGTVSWWDAESACTAAGLTMATVNDLIDNWNGTTGTETRTERAQKLYDAIGRGIPIVWTSDINPSNSCDAFYVYLSNGKVGINGRTHHFYFRSALCH